MTLDEAIIHAQEIVDKHDSLCKSYEYELQLDMNQMSQCKAEHQQLLNWLKELKHYRELNGIQ
jgi:hypothetical protein